MFLVTSDWEDMSFTVQITKHIKLLKWHAISQKVKQNMSGGGKANVILYNMQHISIFLHFYYVKTFQIQEKKIYWS